MTLVKWFMYIFFFINFLLSKKIRNISYINKCISILSIIGLFFVYLFSINPYIKSSEIAIAKIVEINDSTLTYEFKTANNTQLTNTVDCKNNNHMGDVGDPLLVRYIYYQPNNNKINTIDTIFNTELSLISFAVFIIFMLWGILIGSRLKNHEKGFTPKKYISLCIAYLVFIALMIYLPANMMKERQDTDDLNKTMATVIKTDITGTEYKFIGNNNSEKTEKAIGVYSFEMPQGYSVLVEYDQNNNGYIANDLLDLRIYTIISYCLIPFFANWLGFILAYIFDFKNKKHHTFLDSLFKIDTTINTLQWNKLMSSAFKIVSIAIFVEAILRSKEETKTAVMLLFLSIIWLSFAIIFDIKNKKK